MADIYRHELEIQEKSKAAGLILLGVGGLMLLIAVGMFFNTSRQMARVRERPWEQAPGKVSVSSDNEMEIGGRDRGYVNRVFLLWALFALLSLMMFFLVATLIHRFAQHLRSMNDKSNAKSKPKPPYSDPWKESAEKIQVDDTEL